MGRLASGATGIDVPDKEAAIPTELDPAHSVQAALASGNDLLNERSGGSVESRNMAGVREIAAQGT